MNVLYKTKVVLIGNMEHSDGSDVRSVTSERLGKIGINVFNHYDSPFAEEVNEGAITNDILKKALKDGDYDLVASYKKIRSLDLALIDKSDFIIVYYDSNIKTCGTWEEFFWANRQKKPIFFVSVNGKKEIPLWVFWTIKQEYMYETIEDVFKKIEQINNGEVVIDSDRWRLLRKDLR